MTEKWIAIVVTLVAAAVLLLGNGADLTSRELGTAIVFKKSSGLQSQVSNLERELKVLNSQQNVVGLEHIQRLWQRLLDLWNKGALTRAKAEQLYQLLLSLYYRLDSVTQQDRASQAAREENERKKKDEEAKASVVVKSDLTPPPATMILPFEISQISDAVSSPMLSFGSGGGASADIYFYVKPGTILRASAAGKVSLMKNPVSRTPDGQPFDPQDWELQIQLDGGYSLGYDHVVRLTVADGDLVEVGQALARAAPASIRHGGPEGQLPVEEFEFGLGYADSRRGGQPVRVCPANYLASDERAKLESIGNPCLVQETAG